MIMLTQKLFNQGKADGGSWNKRQLELLGVDVGDSWNLTKGWKNKILGKFYPDHVIEEFLALKGTSKQQRKKEFRKKQLSLLDVPNNEDTGDEVNDMIEAMKSKGELPDLEM